MRSALILMLVAALGGCATVRKSLGEYQKIADKGIGFNTGPDAPTPPQAAAAKGNTLPEGLRGDKVHPAYTSPQR